MKLFIIISIIFLAMFPASAQEGSIFDNPIDERITTPGGIVEIKAKAIPITVKEAVYYGFEEHSVRYVCDRQPENLAVIMVSFKITKLDAETGMIFIAYSFDLDLVNIETGRGKSFIPEKSWKAQPKLAYQEI